ncbi:MAG: PQQ-binding-like beta-propeller repeat protein [Bacteroidetes bacterium]|nr:PQQ-binding-like beta-propeller repeat protein [Bacteroidota bacterium]
MIMIRFLIILSVVSLPFFGLAYTGEVLESYDTPGQFPTGLTFDGKYIWLADRKDDKLYAIDPADGQTVKSLPSPGYWPTGLAWDGKYLWNADVKGGIPLAENYNGKIYMLDPENGTLLRTLQAPSSTPRGLTWDGKYLWCADNDSDEIIQFDPGDGTTIRSFRSPAYDPQGITWDGTYLWISDRRYDEIYMVDPESGCVLIIAEAPGPYTTDLCYDGQYLWAVDYENDKLYKLSVRDKDQFHRSNEHEATVRYTHLTTNFGPGKVQTLDVHFAVATERDNQAFLSEISYEPEYSDIVTDKWGQRTAHWKKENIAAGQTHEIQITSHIKTWDVRYFIYPEKAGKPEDIPKEISSKFLEDNDKYDISNPVIQNAVKQAVGDEKNPCRMARRIYNYVLGHLSYEMVGGWNTAPTVLERGNGSCSEYTFVYIALCRAAGIPARYVGSVVMRGDDASMDDVFHRWAEIYLPGYGWIPVDPSGGDSDIPREQADSFGALVNRFYITTQSGGGSETMEWTYNSNEFWTSDPKTNVVFENFADWEP